jgi:hypothetical protein
MDDVVPIITIEELKTALKSCGANLEEGFLPGGISRAVWIKVIKPLLEAGFQEVKQTKESI